MSHLSAVKVTINQIEPLMDALRSFGFQLIEGQHYVPYSVNPSTGRPEFRAGHSLIPLRGYDSGTPDAHIVLPWEQVYPENAHNDRWLEDSGFIWNQDDEVFTLQASHMALRPPRSGDRGGYRNWLGKNFGDVLQQEYSVAAVVREAAQQGRSVERQLIDGTPRLVLTTTGGSRSAR